MSSYSRKYKLVFTAFSSCPKNTQIRKMINKKQHIHYKFPMQMNNKTKRWQNFELLNITVKTTFLHSFVEQNNTPTIATSFFPLITTLFCTQQKHIINLLDLDLAIIT